MKTETFNHAADLNDKIKRLESDIDTLNQEINFIKEEVSDPPRIIYQHKYVYINRERWIIFLMAEIAYLQNDLDKLKKEFDSL